MKNHPSLSEIYSGTYKPTISDEVNVATSIFYDTNYQKVGNTVTVAVRCYIDQTAAGLVSFYINLPIKADHAGSSIRTVGSGSWLYGNTEVGNVMVTGEGVTDARALVRLIAPNTSALSVVFNFQYDIV